MVYVIYYNGLKARMERYMSRYTKERRRRGEERREAPIAYLSLRAM
jgi:hypothetical protein